MADTDTNGSENGKPAMKGLPTELIAELMASGRKRNAYGPKLLDWYSNSDEPAINVREVWALEFGKAKATTLYQGFMLAAKAAEIQDNIIVKRLEDEVFLLHKERCAVAVAEADAEAITVEA
jgi:hypothetical protein